MGISGSCAYLAPEKAGIWPYPYPISYYENQRKEVIFSDKEYMDSMSDGEQTAFNSKYFANKTVNAELAYLSAIETEYLYNANTGILSVKMPKDRTAKFFELNVK